MKKSSLRRQGTNRRRLWPLVFAAGVAACSSSNKKLPTNDGGGQLDQNAGGQTGTMDGATAPSGTTDMPGCSGTASQCALGTSGGQCGDTFMSAVCESGAWKCPSGRIDSSLCGCFNSAPVCHPATSNRTCSSEVGTPTCGGGLWRCPDGMITSLQCACTIPADTYTGSADAGCP